MSVSDPKFAAELVSEKGKVFTFDAIECLAAHVATGGEGTPGTAWVTDFYQAGTWVKAEEAFYVRSPALRSPMALNIAAFKTRADFEKAKGEYRGAELRWQEVLELVQTSGFVGRVQEKKQQNHPHGMH